MIKLLKGSPIIGLFESVDNSIKNSKQQYQYFFRYERYSLTKNETSRQRVYKDSLLERID